MSSHQNTSLIYKLPIEALYYIFECMTEKDQLNFALSRWCFYKVFRTYHIGYSSPKWFPINITRHVMEGSGDILFSRELEPINNLTRNIPNAPPAANYHDGVLLNGKLYLTIFEKESPICWILDFDIIPLNWRRVNVTFVEFDLDDDEVDELESSNITEYKKQSDVNVRTYKPEMNRQKSIYQPLRSTTAAAISPMIYLFGGECLTTGEPSGTLYVLDPIRMILKEIMGQGGDLPSARKMHSLNAIGSQCLVLFGGRCLMNGKFL
ncbi:hypothetical protein C1645_201338 [Glomus cerebriforme]|uniref:F-box domain-containing protein n=1 Tax=Glomus cerebriforme TaxID=658196 RepID=A0A397ST78_9GLOM|nr:hypothetical protein C1645_201338 [Glomus cerebriforme]